MTENVLSIRNLSAVSERGHRSRILRDVCLDLRAGQVLGIVGESGAGKSTVAKALLGILPRTVKIVGGSAIFSGRDLLKLSPNESSAIMGSEITLIPQDPMTSLNPGRRVESQLSDGLRLRRGLSRSEARRRCLAMLEDVHIRDPERVMQAYPHQLSGGMRQRILIAAAFAMEPKLVVADEPTTALDVTVQKQILRLIRLMQDKHGTSVIFVTHDLGVVSQVCDSFVLLYGGMVIDSGPTSQMFSTSSHEYTRALLAAAPRYDRPDGNLQPVPDSTFMNLRVELAARDARNHV